MNYSIREMKKGDAYGIACVHVDSWRTTYQGIVPQSYLDSLNVKEREQRWEKILDEYPENSNYGLVAVNEQSEIVGFAVCDQAEEQESVDGELNAIYVLEQYQQQGIGVAFMRKVLANFRERGWKTFAIIALADNPSFPFYEKLNPHYLRIDTFTVHGEELREWVMTFSVDEVEALLSEVRG
ncbi:GNAT family N-acetyltransferase [Natribacillus halophilus]|uniref:L-amino acid N-acyltransferase YncA n=1 Tax=Natribacillus halophilus TaxID=549003 RepID=A0A1G8QHX6_9BACI|nr:GNAT family N-acetyltransferase [Natribacillus halophilus]SDJ04327.1 L-amino acid N-acyltransferase YncA [Natribacillus halophilus]